jgi:lactoylglutathione lyase
MTRIFVTSIIVLTSFFAYCQNDDLVNNLKTKNSSNMLGLRTTIYKVANLNEAKEWYSKAFGTKQYFDEPYYVGFNIGGYELGLLPEENPNTNKAESVLSYWGVDDIEKAFARLIELGAIVHEKPTNVGGDLMVASVKDPWGNIIGIIYNPEFKLPE